MPAQRDLERTRTATTFVSTSMIRRAPSATTRIWPTLLLALAVAAACASVALAKEGAQAHLLAPLPAHPAAGSTIRIRWTVDVPGPHGRRVPFGASGMFVQLRGRAGATTRAFADRPEPPYGARIRVPAGGIRSVRFGLEGTSCDASGCRPSPAWFPLR